MKKIILSTATVVLSVFLASCSNQHVADDSSEESSVESIETVESSSESKLDHAVPLFDEFEEQYPELKSYKSKSLERGK